MSASSGDPVVIVGGGLAGLACARALAARGVPFTIVEASDRLGGRVRTDVVEGFLLDRGFQVLLTAYPEARAVLDYRALDLREFRAGALVRAEGRFWRVADPWRDPGGALESLRARVGSLGDKLRVERLRRRLRRTPLDAILAREETTTRDALRHSGFSEKIVERFFRPFLSGVFLERELATSSAKFEFVMKMFAEGAAALPARGMGAIPAQLGAALPKEAIRLGAAVRSAEGAVVTLASGERLPARAIVLATAERESRRLLGVAGGERPENSATCFQYAAEKAPIDEPILALDGEGRGPVNDVCVPSVVAPSYAPPGAALVSATVVGRSEGGEALERAVRDQLGAWFGEGVRGWRLLRAVAITRALPAEPPGSLAERRPPRVRPGLYVCGDHLDFASIQGALASGRRAGEAVAEDLLLPLSGRRRWDAVA